jgi:hypothetical protein
LAFLEHGERCERVAQKEKGGSMDHSERSGGYQLSVLSAIMARYSPHSAAQRDFLGARDELLGDIASGVHDDVRVLDEVWDYWSRVAAGKNLRYDARGERAPLR